MKKSTFNTPISRRHARLRCDLTTRWCRLVPVLVALSCGLMGGAAIAAQDASSPPPPPQQPQKPQKQDATLDDLLGLEEDEETRRAQEVAEMQRREELERALIEEQIEDGFRQALALMTNAAELLAERFDTGLATQRVQEDILRKLEDLINSARQQQSNSSSSSSSSQQQQQQQRPRPQQQNQESENQDQQSNEAMQSDATAVRQPPDTAVDLGQLLDESRIEWGALPERVREQLLQARNTKASILYQRLTADYFRRLAEND